LDWLYLEWWYIDIWPISAPTSCCDSTLSLLTAVSSQATHKL